MRPIDADKLIIDVMKQAVVTDDSYGMGISRGIDIAINVINDAPTVDLDEIRKETAEEIVGVLTEQISEFQDFEIVTEVSLAIAKLKTLKAVICNKYNIDLESEGE